MVRHPADHVANGLAGTLKLHLVTQQSEFRIAWNALDRGQVAGKGADDPLGCVLAHEVIDIAEFGDHVLMLEAPEIPEDGVGVQRPGQPPSGVGQPEGRLRLLRRQIALLHRLDDRPKAQADRTVARLSPCGPVAKEMSRLREFIEPGGELVEALIGSVEPDGHAGDG